MTESRDSYLVTGASAQELARQLNFIHQRIADRLDKIEGIRGAAVIKNSLSVPDILTLDDDGAAFETDVTTTGGVSMDGPAGFFASQGGGWRDMIGQAVPPPAGPTIPAWTSWGGSSPFSGWLFALNDTLQFVFHLQHDYSPGTDIFLHSHWVSSGTSTGAVRWRFDWTFAKGFNQANYDSVGSTVYVEENGAGTAWRHMTSEISTAISSDDFEVDGILIVKLTRVAPTTGSHTGNVFLLTSDCHYQSNTFNTKNRQPDFYE